MTESSAPRTPFAEATFDAVIFDMDGTLIDSGAAVLRSWVRWAEEEGLDPHVLAGTHGRTARSIVAEHVPADRVDASLARVDALELADLDGIALLPGVAEALQAVSGARWAIATSCSRALAAARIGAAGLPTPEVLVTADDVENGKPAPDAFLLAAQRLGVEPKRALVIEDAANGVRAARAAGCPVLAVSTTMSWDKLEADVVVPDLSVVDLSVVDGRVHVVVWQAEGTDD